MTLKEAVEKALGIAPAVSDSMRSEMKYAAARLRSMERIVGMRDDPPTHSPDNDLPKNFVLHAKAK